jgi:hypothetical protein
LLRRCEAGPAEESGFDRIGGRLADLKFRGGVLGAGQSGRLRGTQANYVAYCRSGQVQCPRRGRPRADSADDSREGPAGRLRLGEVTGEAIRYFVANGHGVSGVVRPLAEDGRGRADRNPDRSVLCGHRRGSVDACPPLRIPRS